MEIHDFNINETDVFTVAITGKTSSLGEKVAGSATYKQKTEIVLSSTLGHFLNHDGTKASVYSLCLGGCKN